MSDVDLLKQAAAKLREHAEAAVHDDFEDIGWAAAARGPVGEFTALMSPTLAVALATLLDGEVTHAEDWPEECGRAYAVARAVLGVTQHAHDWIDPTFSGFPRFCMCGAREGEVW